MKNLSDREVTQLQREVLAKGLNFALWVTPKQSYFSWWLICHLKPQASSRGRIKTPAKSLRSTSRAEQPPYNLTAARIKTSLSCWDSKGDAVVLNHRKVILLLEDQHTYENNIYKQSIFAKTGPDMPPLGVFTYSATHPLLSTLQAYSGYSLQLTQRLY